LHEVPLHVTAIRLDERGIVQPCPVCGQLNRVPFGRHARCGKCRSAIPAPAEPLEVPSAEAFDAVLRSATIPIVVDFWAPWCGPCRMVAPEIARVAADHAGEWLVVKVNTEALPELGNRFGIRSIPTMAIFSGGREAGRSSGARPAAQIEALVRQALTAGY
jgi:thioredoxin 2